MADQFPVQNDQPPMPADSFVADRQTTWAFFNRLTLFAVCFLVLLLTAMAVFLV